MNETQQRIDALVKAHPIVLFMKGSTSFPICGFSGRAVQILKACGVESKDIYSVNVLEDEAIRQGIKEYSNWPPFPSSTSTANLLAAQTSWPICTPAANCNNCSTPRSKNHATKKQNKTKAAPENALLFLFTPRQFIDAIRG